MPESGSDTYFEHYFDSQSDSLGDSDCDVVKAMSLIIEEGLKSVMGCMADLQEHLEQLINSNNALLDPGEHDSLLSDDDNFSRSKTYFWCINLCREVSTNIDDIVSELQTVPRQWADSFDYWSCTNNNLSTFRYIEDTGLVIRWVEGFKAKQKIFNELKEEAKTLRDGVSIPAPLMVSYFSDDGL